MQNFGERLLAFLSNIITFILKLLKYYFITVGIFCTLFMVMIISFVKSCYNSITKELENSKDISLRLEDQDQINKIIKSKPVILNIKLKGTLISRKEPLEKQILNILYSRKENKVYLDDIKTLLERAQKDSNVYALFLEVEELKDAGFGDYYYIRELVKTFKNNSSKPIYVWTNSLTTYSYFLASVGDYITISPTANIFLSGPIFMMLYLGDTFKKIGVDFEVVKQGQFKSVFEPLILSSPSQDTVRMYQELESSLRKRIISEISNQRNVSYAQVYNWFNRSIFTPTEALNNKVVDNIGFEKDVLNIIWDKAQSKINSKPEVISMQSYLKKYSKKTFVLRPKEGIGLIEAYGPIMLDDNEYADIITPEWFKKRIDWATEEDNVKALVIKINSPGGSATASDIIWNYINTFSKIKPVVVYIDSVGASGGYYIALGANKIVACPLAITGSIGVAGVIPKIPKFKDKYGINFYVITQTQRSKLLNPSESSSVEDKKLLESTVEDVYNTFISRVAKGRNLDFNEVSSYAQGQVYSADQALQYKLIDALGTIDTAISEAKRFAGLDVNLEHPIYRYEPDELDIYECFESASKLLKCAKKFNKRADSSSVQLNFLHKRSSVQDLDDILINKALKFKKLLTNERYFALWEGFFWEQSEPLLNK